MRRALTSIEAQTVAVHETLVVDDGSSSDECSRASRIITEFPSARLLMQPDNRGPAHARNTGWNAAKGDWIAFLDADDAWHDRKIELQLSAVAALGHTPAIVATRRSVAPDGGQGPRIAFDGVPEAKRFGRFQLITRNQMATSTVMVPRDLVLRFPEGQRFAEDYELWLKISGLNRPMLRVEAPLAFSFKPPFGGSGLSGETRNMIRGEYRAYLGAYRDGALNRIEVAYAFVVSSLRAAIRPARILMSKRRASR